jgi:hypothetical protein
MNRERDFDQTLRSWLADGADRAPERFVWAALEEVDRIGQRPAWRAALEGFLMKLKPAAPILGVAAVVVLAIAMFQLLGSRDGVGEPSDSPVPTATPRPTTLPTPTRPAVTSLDEIVLGEAHAVPGMSLDTTDRDATHVIVYPTRSARATELAVRELDAFVAGIVTELSGSDSVMVSWVAEFRTPSDAERALAVYLEDFSAPDGWDLELVGTSTADGPEGANFEGSTTRFLPGLPGDEAVPAFVRVWRYENVLLAIGGFHDYDDGLIHYLGDNMAGRAQSYTGADR